MGKPKKHHLQGTKLDNLIELAGRICYDSINSKKSRNSQDYHQHIHDVKHLSVEEHANLVFEVDYPKPETATWFFMSFLNRPGVYITDFNFGNKVRFVANFRSLIERKKWGLRVNETNIYQNLWEAIYFNAQDESTLALPQEDYCDPEWANRVKIVSPRTDDEIWLSFYLQGSRGFSHEVCRHGDFTAISQRSTRYVDESESDWVWHPLISKYVQENKDLVHTLIDDCQEVKDLADNKYQYLANELQRFFIDRGVDKFTARKQARGAAR